MTTTPPIARPVSASDFAMSWGEFLEVLGYLARRKLRRHRSDAFRQNFLPVFDNTLDILRSEENLSDIEQAAANALRDEETSVATRLLHEELRAFVAWNSEIVPADANSRAGLEPRRVWSALRRAGRGRV